MATLVGPLGLEVQTGDASDQFQKYLDVARSETQPDFEFQSNALQQATDLRVSAAEDVATSILNREPLVRQVYANLAKEFEVSQGYEVGQAQKIGEQRIGETRAALAAEGVQNAQGSFRAPLTAEEDALQANVKEIGDRYNVKYETLKSQMLADVGQLQVDAAKYRAEGKNALADGLLKQVQLKQEQTAQITAIASAIQKTQDDNEKRALQQIESAAKIEHDRQMAQIAAFNAQESARSNRVQEGISAMNAQTSRMNAVNKSQEDSEKYLPKFDFATDKSGKKVGLSFSDYRGQPITAAQYFAQQQDGQWNPLQVADFIGSKGGDDDVRKAGEIRRTVESLQNDPTKLESTLKARFPELFGGA